MNQRKKVELERLFAALENYMRYCSIETVCVHTVHSYIVHGISMDAIM